MQKTINFTLNEKCYARIYIEKNKFYVEWLGLFLHEHIIKEYKSYEQALNTYNYIVE